jgi:hypothetical protein
MKKIILFSIAIVLCMASLFSQTTELEKDLRKKENDTITGWKKGGSIGINLSQASFTNWAAGGENSIAALGQLSLFAKLVKEKSIWDNNLDLAYGLMKQASEDNLRKTDDKIDFTSKYGIKASKNWYYSALVNFKTQFADGYNYPDDSTKISGFLAPGYLLAGIGMDYQPGNKLDLYLSPLTYKLVIVNDQDLADMGSFGVDPAEYDDQGGLIKHGKKTKTKFGAYLRGNYKVDIMKNISFHTKLELFSNYLKNPQNIDVNWENLLAMTVNKYISVDITTQLIYDDEVMILVDENTGEIGPRTQFKQTLMVGLTYKF